MAVDLDDRHHKPGSRRLKGLPRRLRLLDREGPFLEMETLPAGSFHRNLARYSSQDTRLCRARHQIASAGHDPGVAGCAFGDEALIVDHPGLVGARLLRLLAGKGLREKPC